MSLCRAILLFSTKGDTAGADLRIIESNGLSVIENGVTDNSGAVPKAPGRLTDSTANTPCESGATWFSLRPKWYPVMPVPLRLRVASIRSLYKKRGTKNRRIRQRQRILQRLAATAFPFAASPCVFADLWGSLHFFAWWEIQHKRYIHRAHCHLRHRARQRFI